MKDLSKISYIEALDETQKLLENLIFNEATDDGDQGVEEAEISEVYEKNGLRLFEFDMDSDLEPQSVDVNIIKELFPDFEINPDKGYLIGKENGLFTNF